MSRLILLVLLILTGCSERPLDCSPRRDCIKGHYETYWGLGMNMDGELKLKRKRRWVCDEWGPMYVPQGCTPLPAEDPLGG
jgi:hypothetical protein